MGKRDDEIEGGIAVKRLIHRKPGRRRSSGGQRGQESQSRARMVGWTTDSAGRVSPCDG